MIKIKRNILPKILFITGIFCILSSSILFIVLIFNYASIPQFFYSMDNPQLTVIINIVLWGILSALLLEIGLNFHQKSKDFKKFNTEPIMSVNIIAFIGYILVFTVITFIILFLLQIIPSINYFPHQLLSEDAVPIDLSNLFNLFLIYFMINIIYRSGSRLLGRSIQLSQINNKIVNKELD